MHGHGWGRGHRGRSRGGRHRGGDGVRRRSFHALHCGGHSRSFSSGVGLGRCTGHAGTRALRGDLNRSVHRRVGLAEIRSADQDGVLGRRLVLGGLVEVVEQRHEVELHSVGGQGRQAPVPATQAVGLRAVQSDREMRCCVQDLVDKPGQHATGTDLDEPRDAVARHRLDHVPELHRLADLVGELLGHLLAVRLRGRVRIDRERGVAELERVEVLAQRCRTRRDDLGVERRRDRKPPR